ncbi:hypothetical protein SASPL_148418 [Salvia splendens]|uniref:arginine--tRNA ligase n=1 Tax=Salvia splendens TaxID=180675 RepID=A0A8X8WA91_SALSN|nr:hypothetical protein SASPL_148418 [Salvia splendens]
MLITKLHVKFNIIMILILIPILLLFGGVEARVTIQNYYQYRHVEKPGWKLGWAWAKDEVIWAISGAIATKQGHCKPSTDVKPHCCSPHPLIVATTIEGGLLAAWAINPHTSYSSFDITIGNLDQNRTAYRPPLNLTLTAPTRGYTCGTLRDALPSISFVTGGLREEQVFKDAALFWGKVLYNTELLQGNEYEVGSVTTDILMQKIADAFTLRNGWGFPRRIYFNGENCRMPLPDMFPMLPNGDSGSRGGLTSTYVYHAIILSRANYDRGIAGSPKQQLAKLFEVSLRVTAPEELDIDPAIAPCQNSKFGDYQCNNAMGLWSKVKGKSTQFKNPQQIGQAIKANLPASEMIDGSSIAGPGFVNVKLSDQWIAKCIQNMLRDGIETWAPKLSVKRVVVDFSSPNIAKEMHVGHLRSTIIGDTLARMLEFSNVEVLRRNHVGDWGTQFGMLIEFLFEKFPSLEVVNDQAIGDLEAFYKASKVRFDGDPAFKERAQRAVVSLQAGEEKYLKAWAEICKISRSGYEKVYEHLGVQLEEKGESFYNPYIPNALELLNKEGLIEDSEGARVIFVEGKKIPLIVVKRDGGYNYASTDLAALWYRLNEEKAEWIIYLTDVGQREHFEMLFAAAKRAGWLPAGDSKYPKTSHVGFGLVLGEDGKRFRTRSTETVKLVDLLTEAKSRCKTALIERGKDKAWTEEELDKTAEAVGYGAVKYADLKNNRTTNYTFSFDQMLNDKGNTAVYLLYAHARICSIIRKSGKDIEELKKVWLLPSKLQAVIAFAVLSYDVIFGLIIVLKDWNAFHYCIRNFKTLGSYTLWTGKIDLAHPGERVLGLHLLQFAEVGEESITNLLPNGLCEYLYNLSEYFTGFYTNCQVVGSAEETSRLLLCEATAVVMRKCFHLLGITPVYKI